MRRQEADSDMTLRDQLLESILASGIGDPMLALERDASLSMETVLRARAAVPINECGEELIDAGANFPGWEPHPYRSVGAPYGARSPYSMRLEVERLLARAQELLAARAPGLKLCIVDAYRPLAVQHFMVEYQLAALARERGVAPDQIDAALRGELMGEVLKVWAAPNTDPACPPPHSTGAAVDVTLLDEQYAPIDMGGRIDSSGPESLPNFYADAASEKGRSYHERRELLHGVMGDAGFRRMPHEWWHFSYGDQMWALLNWLCGGSDRPAIYGRVD